MFIPKNLLTVPESMLYLHFFNIPMKYFILIILYISQMFHLIEYTSSLTILVFTESCYSYSKNCNSFFSCTIISHISYLIYMLECTRFISGKKILVAKCKQRSVFNLLYLNCLNVINNGIHI